MFFRRFNLALGVLVSSFLTLAILPVRISEGQGSNPFNLIGSELVIWIMLLTGWICINYIFKSEISHNYQKIIISISLCILCSILFYAISNPFFEDYPNAPAWKNGIIHGIFRLSIRGTLFGTIMVPIVYIFVIKKSIQEERFNNELKRLYFVEQQNAILDDTVKVRTAELQDTIKSLKTSRDQLTHQLYIQSRIIACISHDMISPLKFELIIIKNINKMIEKGVVTELPEYTQRLENAMENTYSLVSNLLDFAKTQLKTGPVYIHSVCLSELVIQKVKTFEDLAAAKDVVVENGINPDLYINTNPTLLSIIIHNLVDNAIKFSASNHAVTIQSKVVNGHINLIVSNYSISLPYESETRPEQQKQSILVGQQGTNMGIGLLLVEEISSLLNIDVKSEIIGSRTVFSLRFNNT